MAGMRTGHWDAVLLVQMCEDRLEELRQGPVSGDNLSLAESELDSVLLMYERGIADMRKMDEELADSQERVRVLKAALKLAGEYLYRSNAECPRDTGDIDDDKPCPVEGTWLCNCDRDDGGHDEECRYCSREHDDALKADCWRLLIERQAAEAAEAAALEGGDDRD